MPAIAGDGIAGVDEVGRGPLIGAVVCAAVILDPDHPVDGLNDSKKLSERRRQQLDEEIRANAVAYAFGRAEACEIDEINILQATMQAMRRAIEALPVAPTRVIVDGNRVPECAYPVSAQVGGDSVVAEICAASVLAKVARDREMVEMDARFPGYGLARHKGYPTAEHLEALRRLGPTPEHRRSFAPVRRLVSAL